MKRRHALSALKKSFFLGRKIFRVRIVRRRRRNSTAASKKKFVEHKESARALVHRKLEEFNRHYGFVYHRVTIRDQRSRWGSASKKGNLNFNYRIVHLPEQLADAIIVHELCHLKEFNHSKKFWSLVGETIPDHKARKQALGRMSATLLQ